MCGALPRNPGGRRNRGELGAQQSKVALSLTSVGAEELARVQVAHNAIAVRVDASQLEQIALIPGVAKVRPVLNYEMSLSETVPYVGGTAVQQSGKSVQDAPTNGEKGARDSNAPIVNVPAGKAAERQPAAPIVDVPARK